MNAYENIHPTMTVKVGDQSAEIDELLAPTIKAIWQNGLRTFTSCQDLGKSNASWVEKLPHMSTYVESRRGWMLIDFPIDDGMGFLEAVANAGPRDDFYVRMTHWAAPDAWDRSIHPMDWAMNHEEEPSRGCVGHSRHRLSASFDTTQRGRKSVSASSDTTPVVALVA